MSITVSSFGVHPDGRKMELYTISNGKGMQVSITNIGATLVKVITPDKNGVPTDVILGFEKGEDYVARGGCFGAVVGPNANRTSNACFTLDGVTYKLDVNNGVNNLHSHKEKGWHKRLWEAELHDNRITFSLEDADGNLGFPGNRKASVTYILDEENALTLHYHAVSDKKTVLNLTNHVYFNLEGHDSGSIEDHELWLAASHYTPADAASIPTGEIAAVKGTPMDFTSTKKVGRDINADFDQLKFGNGYDHNWVIDGWDGTLRHFATVKAPGSGIYMEAYTTLPGVQVYAGNSVKDQAGKDNAVYDFRAGLCLETQYFPDSANKPQFPSCIFGAGREYDSVTVYKFGTL